MRGALASPKRKPEDQKMKRYRKFECWLADVDRCLDHPAETADESLLGILAYSFTHFSDQLPRNIDQLQNLVAVLKKLREVCGAGRAVFEKRVMQSLADCALSVCSQLHESGCYGSRCQHRPI